MAWKEMSGSRRVEENGLGPGVFVRDTIISFIGIAGTDTKPSNGNKLTNILGSGTLSSTGLDAEPSAVQISDVRKITELACQVTVKFRGWCVE